MVILRSQTPEDGGNPDSEPPQSPSAAKRGGQKSPKEIELEKKLSRVEDKVDSLQSTVDGFTNFLADIFPSGKPRKPSDPSPAPEKHWLDDLLGL